MNSFTIVLLLIQLKLAISNYVANNEIFSEAWLATLIDALRKIMTSMFSCKNEDATLWYAFKYEHYKNTLKLRI